MKPQQVALATGVFMGGLHLFWALLIALGLAQPLMDFIYGIHMLNNPFIVAPFSLGSAIVLVLVTSIVGYIAGWLFALLWNKLHKIRA